jgi:hypothetical protein
VEPGFRRLHGDPRWERLVSRQNRSGATGR